MNLNDKNDALRRINELNAELLKEQVKASATIELVGGIDYCIKLMDKGTDLLADLLKELGKRSDGTLENRTWSDLEALSEPHGLTAGEVIKNSCDFFTEKRRMMSEVRDRLMTIMMTMQDMEKQHRKFKEDNEGDFDGS